MDVVQGRLLEVLLWHTTGALAFKKSVEVVAVSLVGRTVGVALAL